MVSDVLDMYGDIADVMELFGDGLKRAGKYSVRRQIAKTITVEHAASMHKVPLEEFLELLQRAVASKAPQAAGTPHTAGGSAAG